MIRVAVSDSRLMSEEGQHDVNDSFTIIDRRRVWPHEPAAAATRRLPIVLGRRTLHQHGVASESSTTDGVSPLHQHGVTSESSSAEGVSPLHQHGVTL
ncbi:hypothetical protein E2C01_020135 [Portunus trituberculatus]|uniref:Uncharacterized protein n=1 Tax=Portunus trituberculatus TaxID=210409 RepID=A0A5B7E2C5_PORTR|nr:hypothetical protein [Portunus trituberculatus]